MTAQYTLHRYGEPEALGFPPFETFEDAVVVANTHSGSRLEFALVWGDHAWEAKAPDGKYYTIRWHPEW